MNMNMNIYLIKTITKCAADRSEAKKNTSLTTGGLITTNKV